MAVGGAGRRLRSFGMLLLLLPLLTFRVVRVGGRMLLLLLFLFKAFGAGLHFRHRRFGVFAGGGRVHFLIKKLFSRRRRLFLSVGRRRRFVVVVFLGSSFLGL